MSVLNCLFFLMTLFVPHSTFAAKTDAQKIDVAEGRIYDLRYLTDNAVIKKKIFFGTSVPFGEAKVDDQRTKATFVFRRGRGAGLDIQLTTVPKGFANSHLPKPIYQLWDYWDMSQVFILVSDPDELAEAGFPSFIKGVIYSVTPPEKDPTGDIRAFVTTGDFVFQMVVAADGTMTLRCPLCGDVNGAFCDYMSQLNQLRYLCPDCRSGGAAKRVATDEVTVQKDVWKMGRITRKSVD